MKLLRFLASLSFALALLLNPVSTFAQECEGQCESPPPSDPGPGSGPEDGGGHELITDPLPLEITKVISFDGEHFFDPNSAERPVAIPEEKTTVVYVLTTVKNLGEVSAIDIHLGHDFIQGYSDMVSDSVELIRGDVEYNASTDVFTIPKLPAKYSMTFLYTFLIHELGQNNNPGTDVLTVEAYKSALPVVHEALVYVSLGEKFASYFLAKPPSEVDDYNVSSGYFSGGGDSLDDSGDFISDGKLPPKLVSVGISTWLLALSFLMSSMLYLLFNRVHYLKK